MKKYKKIYPVILSGGTGTRLWPMSTELFPKQFSKNINKKSLFSSTLSRFNNHQYRSPIIITSENFRFIVKDAVEEMGIKPSAILLEPMSKNTAAAITLSSVFIKEIDPQAIVLVVPSDHFLPNIKKFNLLVSHIIKNFDENFIYLFGTKPKSSNQGFGYIQAGKKICKNQFSILKFIEKPEKSLAEKLMEKKDIFWNLGIFLFSVNTFFDQMKIYSEDNLNISKNIVKKKKKEYEFFSFPKKDFKKFTELPIDKLLVEKTKKKILVPTTFEWSDIGTWDNYWDTFKYGKHRNLKDGNIITKNVSNSLIKINGESFALVMGLKDVVVIKENDSLLVSKKNHLGFLKEEYKKIKKLNAEVKSSNNIIYRPWGSFENVRHGIGFLIKILKIKPYNKISLQYHNHRSEHWVITRGKATIDLEGKQFILEEKKSIFIEPRQKHRISNLTSSMLEIVEVQIGSNLDEKDIVRLDDIYGRAKKK